MDSKEENSITSKNSASGLKIEEFHWETTNFTVSFSKIAIQGFEYLDFFAGQCSKYIS
jgi:hypothetical protein